MRAQHTAGPWKVNLSEYKEHEITNYTGQMAVAQVYLFDGDEQTKANAHLIAAAPELLEALIPFSELKGRSVLELNDMMRKAKAAIKKATGE